MNNVQHFLRKYQIERQGGATRAVDFVVRCISRTPHWVAEKAGLLALRHFGPVLVPVPVRLTICVKPRPMRR